jgi:hypothetical protein
VNDRLTFGDIHGEGDLDIIGFNETRTWWWSSRTAPGSE